MVLIGGLEISKETALCEEYMGRYPVISVSLKGIDAWSYETAYQMAVRVIIDEAAKFYFLLDSEKLNAHAGNAIPSRPEPAACETKARCPGSRPCGLQPFRHQAGGLPLHRRRIPLPGR